MSTVTTPVTTRQLPPHPKKAHLLFGNGYYFALKPMEFLLENTKAFEGGIYRVTSIFKKLMIVQDPDYVKYILQDNNKNYTKSFGYEILQLLLGKGLLTSEGEFWRKQRRLAQPAFHRERLALLTQTMVDCINEQAERLEQLKEKQNVDISREMMAVTLNIVARAMFSSDIKDAITEVGKEMDITNELAIERIKNPFRLPNWVPTPMNMRERRSIQSLDKVMNGIIEKRRKSAERYDDLLAMLMEAKDEETGEQMTDVQLRDETMTIFLAGHETTATVLTWLWYLLDKNPEQAQKLYDEVDTVLQGRTPTFEDVMRLPYSRLVVEEALRLYPPVWMVGRKNIEDDEIGGYLVPKGTNVLMPVYHMHRDPRIWDEPNEFRPERFKKENMKDKHRFAYFPFGGGPRLCIGNNFALMEMQLIVAMLAQKFRFPLSTGFEPELNPLITLRTKAGMKVDIVKREVSTK